MLSYRTAGESHGKGILALVEGLPAGWTPDLERVREALRLRQGGYGRSSRQGIERDAPEILSGLRRGRTIGAPVAIWIPNRDVRIDRIEPKGVPRPGHADLAGALKLATGDIHDVAERASARETAGRVAAGSLAAGLLAELGTEVVGYVTAVGGVRAPVPRLPSGAAACRAARARSVFYALDAAMDARLRRRVDAARRAGDTVGGVLEVAAFGVPAGLGSHVQWDERLDGNLARAVMAIPAVKGVEIGEGFRAAGLPGSRAHDAIRSRGGRWERPTNRAGGIEGGITNGETVLVRAAMKPLSTLMRPLPSADLSTRKAAKATVIRSDACAVSACAIVAEAVVAFELARAALARFGGDSIGAFRRAARRSGAFAAL